RGDWRGNISMLVIAQKMRGNRKKIGLIAFLALAAIAVFLLYDLGRGWEFALRLRSLKIAAVIVVACAVAYSSVAFQTLTNNRILTPSIMGFESVFMLLQTLLVFLYGAETFKMVNSFQNFLLSIACMIGFAFLLYLLIYKKGVNN